MADKNLLEKLAEILAALGLTDEQVNKIVGDVESTVSEEVAQEGGNPEEENPAPEETPEEPAPEEEGAPVPPTEVPEPETDAPAGDGSIESVLAEAAAQEDAAVPPEEQAVPPTPEQPPVPEVDPLAKIAELESTIEEYKKANDGLIARIDSLEQALKAAGVIDGNSATVGDETPRVTPNASAGEESPLDDIIGVINGKNR